MLYYALLYYTRLYYAILYYTILYYAILYSTIRYSALSRTPKLKKQAACFNGVVYDIAWIWDPGFGIQDAGSYIHIYIYKSISGADVELDVRGVMTQIPQTVFITQMPRTVLMTQMSQKVLIIQMPLAMPKRGPTSKLAKWAHRWPKGCKTNHKNKWPLGWCP